MKNNLRHIEEYRKMEELKPQWKKDLDKVNQDLLELDDYITDTIDKLSVLSSKREKLIQSRKSILENATSPSLF